MAKGFKGPKMNNPMGMMGQLQKLQEQLKVAQDQLAEESVPYSAGGGAVKVVMTGDQRCLSVEIDRGAAERWGCGDDPGFDPDGSQWSH